MLGVQLNRFLHGLHGEPLTDSETLTARPWSCLPPIGCTERRSQFPGTTAPQNQNSRALLNRQSWPRFLCPDKCHVNLIPITENIIIYSVSFSQASGFTETLMYSNTAPYQTQTTVFFLKIQKISLSLFKMGISILKRCTTLSTYVIPTKNESHTFLE